MYHTVIAMIQLLCLLLVYYYYYYYCYYVIIFYYYCCYDYTLLLVGLKLHSVSPPPQLPAAPTAKPRPGAAPGARSAPGQRPPGTAGIEVWVFFCLF